VRGPLYNLALAEACWAYGAALDWLRKLRTRAGPGPGKDPNLASLRELARAEAIERQMERTAAGFQSYTSSPFPTRTRSPRISPRPAHAHVYASSVHRSKIFAIGRDGKLRDFIGRVRMRVWSILALSWSETAHPVGFDGGHGTRGGVTAGGREPVRHAAVRSRNRTLGEAL